MAKMSELEKWLKSAGLSGWKAKVVLGSITFTEDSDRAWISHTWGTPTIAQIAGITKEVAVAKTGSGGVRTRAYSDIAVTFNDNTDVSKIVVTPEPENLVRGENTLSWRHTGTAGGKKEWLLSLTS